MYYTRFFIDCKVFCFALAEKKKKNLPSVKKCSQHRITFPPLNASKSLESSYPIDHFPTILLLFCENCVKFSQKSLQIISYMVYLFTENIYMYVYS